MRLITKGRARAVEYKLGARKFRIGSAQKNELALPGSSVSRQHAVIERRFFRYFITDLKSTNGTFVDNLRVKGRARLRHGSELRIADLDFEVKRSRSFYLLSGLEIAAACFVIAFVVTRQVLHEIHLKAHAAGSPAPKLSKSRVAHATPPAAAPEKFAGRKPPKREAVAGTSSKSKFAKHDLTSMAYLLCAIHTHQIGDTEAPAQALYQAARRMSGPGAKLSDENAVRSGRPSEAYFSYDPNPAYTGDVERQHFIDWVARLKNLVEKRYYAYTLVIGKSLIERRSALLLTDPAANGPTFPGATYRWEGKWSSTTNYKRGDLVITNWQRIYIVAKANVNIDPQSNRRGTGFSGRIFPGTWQPFPSGYFCSSLSDALAARIGDSERVGGYIAALHNVEEKQKTANEIRKLNN